MIYLIIFSILATVSYWLWRYKFIPAEVKLNAADIAANGSQDSLQRGYHSRRSWARVWPGLACCVVPAGALAFASWWAASLGFGAMAALLAGCFARYFTPLLNLAMHLAYKPEFYASPASKSWPDAAAWVKVRRSHYLTDADEQAAANDKLKSIVLTTWYECLAAAALLAVAAGWVAINS
ncbi:MAG: hypothetical protein ACRYFZ_09440 [Janthinobacterium lividum]